MKTFLVWCGLLVVMLSGPDATAQSAVFFEERFDGPTLDPSVWRTELLTSGPRWCAVDSGPWAPGTWVEEGVACHGVAVHAPYGSATMSGGWLSLSSGNDRAFPTLLSRLPGAVELFPAEGDFTLKVRMRYDRVTPWGDGFVVYQAQSTEPSGGNSILPENVLMMMWCDNPGGGVPVSTGLGGAIGIVAQVPGQNESHEFVLDCVGETFTISADGQIVYGPVTSVLRPTAVSMGNPSLAFWYPTDWTSFSVDDIRVEVPSVPVAERSWGAVKAMFQ